MPFRTWMYAVALGLGLTTLGYAQEENSPLDQAAAVQDPNPIDLPGPLPVIIIESDESAKTRSSIEAARAQREKDGLAAQQGIQLATEEMNQATQSMKNAAWLSTVLVGAGTVLLIWTLILTKNANKAAQAAVEVTRTVGKAQTRAYVFFNMERIAKPFEIDIGNPTEISVDFEITNLGQTPAHNVRYIAEVIILNRSEKFGSEFFKIMGGQPIPDASLEPSGAINATAESAGPFIETDFRDCFLPEGNKRIFLIGQIFYDDVFDVSRETKFCYYLEPTERIRDDNFELGMSRWEQYAQHNSAN